MDSSSDSDSEEEAPKKAAAKKEDSSDSDSSDSDSDEKPAKKAEVKKDDSSDSDSDEEPAKKVEAAKQDSSDSDSSDSDEETAAKKDSDSDSESEDEKAKESSSDSDSSDEEAEVESKKRPAEEAEEAEVSTKKVKTDESQDTTVFVGNLSWNVTEDQLAEVFAECGEVKATRIITDKQTGRAKGYGYVEFGDTESAKKAIALTGTNVDGREIRVDMSAPKPTGNRESGGKVDKPQSAPSKILFLGNLAFNVEEEEIRQLFSAHGAITSLRFPTDRETGAFKGFGYLEYDSVDAAKAAVDALNGRNIAGRSVRLDYSQPRDSVQGNRGGFGGRGRGNDRGRGRGGQRGGRGGNRGASKSFPKPSGTKITF